MSSLVVRQFTETAIANIGTVPFYRTINEMPDPQDDIWLTVDYDALGMTKETLCDDFLEDGSIRLMFMGRVGVGADTLLAAAESFADAFYQTQDPTERVTLVSREAPLDFAGENDPWFIVEIAVDYQMRI